MGRILYGNAGLPAQAENNLSQIAQRPAKAGDIKIPAVSQLAGELRSKGTLSPILSR